MKSEHYIRTITKKQEKTCSKPAHHQRQCFVGRHQMWTLPAACIIHHTSPFHFFSSFMFAICSSVSTTCLVAQLTRWQNHETFTSPTRVVYLHVKEDLFIDLDTSWLDL